jgi:DNA-binding response OmpR family regulator
VRVTPKRAHANTALDLPKSRSRESGVPAKILVVDDDDLELSLMSDRLGAAGFQVTVATNGEEALAILEKQWFPVILTDWQMPVMDGIQLIEKLRERGGEDCYFIMLSVRASSEDFERGYCAGVDDYLAKKSSDTELMARIEAGLNTVALRRSLRQSRAALALTQAQTEAIHADAKTQLFARLQSEMARARRYQRACSVLVMGVHPSLPAVPAEAAAPGVDANHASGIDESARVAFMQALQGAIRIDVDSVVRYESSERHVQFAIVLPETGPAEVAVIRSRVRAALLQSIREQSSMVDKFDVSVGAASVDPSIDRPALTPEELLNAAEHCRRCMASCGARRLAAVQASVVSQVAIPCRYGYAVADHCLELDHRYADERQGKAPASAAAPQSVASPFG